MSRVAHLKEQCVMARQTSTVNEMITQHYMQVNHCIRKKESCDMTESCHASEYAACHGLEFVDCR